jgi:hypothetical protein
MYGWQVKEQKGRLKVSGERGWGLGNFLSLAPRPLASALNDWPIVVGFNYRSFDSRYSHYKLRGDETIGRKGKHLTPRRKDAKDAKQVKWPFFASFRAWRLCVTLFAFFTVSKGLQLPSEIAQSFFHVIEG